MLKTNSVDSKEMDKTNFEFQKRTSSISILLTLNKIFTILFTVHFEKGLVHRECLVVKEMTVN